MDEVNHCLTQAIALPNVDKETKTISSSVTANER